MIYLVSIQKWVILSKVKSKIPDFERENTKIVTIQIFIGTGIHTLKYFAELPALGRSLRRTPFSGWEYRRVLTCMSSKTRSHDVVCGFCEAKMESSLGEEVNMGQAA